MLTPVSRAASHSSPTERIISVSSRRQRWYSGAPSSSLKRLTFDRLTSDSASALTITRAACRAAASAIHLRTVTME
eukprot:6530505-Prymnesium_polylepis.2